MIQPASPDNCLKLNQLSAWDDDILEHLDNVPLYSAEYILTKLPVSLYVAETADVHALSVKAVKDVADGKVIYVWQVGYDLDGNYAYWKSAALLPDALCLLAIELFERGLIE